MKAKRVKGTREAPNLPALVPSDFKPFLWSAVKQGAWTIHEAAYYVHAMSLGGSINPQGTNPVSETYAWLSSECHAGRLVSGQSNEQGPLFTPGTVFRYLWENEKPFSLRMWALYDTADKGEVDCSIQTGVSKANYLTAANEVKKIVPNVTKGELVRFLQTLPKAITKENGLPYFLAMSSSYLIKILQGKGVAGRPKNSNIIDLEPYRPELIAVIKNKLGQ